MVQLDSFQKNYHDFDSEQDLKYQAKERYTKKLLNSEVTYDDFHKEFIYNPATGILKNKLINCKQGNLNKDGYLTISFKEKTYLVHRVVYFMYHGHWPKNQIDHINRIKTDNRIVNLRDVSASENQKNKGNSKTTTSGVKGVFWVWQDNRWKTTIMYKNKQVFIGHFKNFINAVKARYYAEQKFGYLLNGISSSAKEYLDNAEKTSFYTNIEFEEESIPKNETIASEWEFFCYENKKKIDKLAEE